MSTIFNTPTFAAAAAVAWDLSRAFIYRTGRQVIISRTRDGFAVVCRA